MNHVNITNLQELRKNDRQVSMGNQMNGKDKKDQKLCQCVHMNQWQGGTKDQLGKGCCLRSDIGLYGLHVGKQLIWQHVYTYLCMTQVWKYSSPRDGKLHLKTAM